MLKLENIEVFNFRGAFRGMRNPLDSWDKSDSKFEDETEAFTLGPKDLSLAQRLIKSGNDHAKFLRQIGVCFDITAPLYFFKEFDTYKVATVANSCSTMHTIHKYPFDTKQFSCENMTPTTFAALMTSINELNRLRGEYLATNSKSYWYSMIQLLPSSWNQKRTFTCNYATLRNMYFARKNHKLDEWHTFCDYILELPYAKELITYTGDENNEGTSKSE